MLKTHYQDDTTETCFRRSADAQIILPLPLTAGVGTKGRPVVAAAGNRDGCSPWAASDWNKSSTKERVMVTGGPWDQPQEGELWGQFHIVQKHSINFQARHKPKKLQQNMKTVLNWCCFSNWTETTLKYKKNSTVTNYTPRITLVMLMKEKSDIDGALHKLHTTRLPDEWHLRLCHYKQIWVVKTAWISPGLADKGPQSLILHRHYLLPDDSTETATWSVLSRTTTHFKRPHYCTQSAPLYPRAC